MGGVKRIILTVTNDLTYDQRMQKICTSLSQAGYKVELVGRVRGFSVPLKDAAYQQKRLTCFFEKGKLFYAEFNIRLFFYLLFSRFDAVCAVDLDTLVPAFFATRIKGAKLACDAHEYFTEVPEVINRPAVKRVWQWVERTFMPRCNLVYTVSDGLAQLYEKQYGIHAPVIMNVPPLTETAVHQAGSEKYLLYQGALNEGRGLEHLIDAMKGIDAKLKIAGEGDLSQYLRRLTKELNLENKIEFLGFVEPRQLKLLTQNAWIGFNLLENKGLSYYYSLSNKFFDYIHAGVPQVCMDFPSYRAINQKYQVAVLINWCSPAQITGAFNQLSRQQDLYRALQKNCDVCTRLLNWQAEEKKLLSLYEQLFE
jgi:glycosyltransferase involved in cell wall biosynthesis